MSERTVMLRGKSVSLRPVLERDVDRMYGIHMDISNRGDYWPLEIDSEVAFRKEFSETGFWKGDSGLLVMVNEHDDLIGDIGYFKPIEYWNATLEIFYRVYDESNRGKGVTTEALGLMTGYLFESTSCERVQLGIDTDNAASRRVAEKAGYTHEGTMRRAWFNRGSYRNVEIYSILRSEAAKG